MFRSVTTCPACNHRSLKFEPFSMLSIPIPANNKDTSMLVTFYFVDQYCLYDLVKIECNVNRDTSLKSIRDGLASSKNTDPKSFNFYLFDGKTIKWKKFDDLSEHLGKVEFPPNNFFFLVQDKSNLLQGDNMVQIIFEIEGVNKETVAQLNKVTLAPQISKVSDLYRFFYECLHNPFRGLIKSFENSFGGSNPNDRLFDLVMNKNVMTYTTLCPEQEITLKHNDIITVKIYQEEVLKHKRINSLGNIVAERYPEDTDVSLKHCFEALTNPEKLDEENKWLCEKCKTKTRANVQLSIKELPQILIIHLKRFKKSAMGSLTKLTDTVNYPMSDLNLCEFTTDPDLLANKQSYSLFGVINHSGSANFGHYTAWVKNRTNPEQWLECDDESAGIFDKNYRFMKNKAYILFYRKQAASKIVTSQLLQEG